MKKIFGIFTQPYPLEEDPRSQLFSSLAISLFVVFFLVIFQPFGLNSVDPVKWPLVKLFSAYVGYGIVTFAITFLSDRLIKPAFPMFFNEAEWTVLKNIFWIMIVVLLIGLGNLFYSSFLGFTGISGSSLLTFQVYTILIGIIPVTFITLIKTIALLRINLKAARDINEKLSTPLSDSVSETHLIFNSENLKDEIKLTLNQFLFAESTENYTDVVYIENGIIKKELIRSTLKRIEDMNTSLFIFRTHRSFLVNLRKVKQVEGNSQGYRLVFENMEETVPVARRSARQVKTLLTKLHKQQ